MALSAVAAYGGCVRRLYTPGGRLLRWYRRTARPLPWRRTADPYAILVSEMMAQQTQIARVLPAYARFLRRFPTLAVLAEASLGDVLREWSGLGYNRRARDLHRIAQAHPDGLPRTVEALDALPGVGAYTAGAVACFAYGQRIGFAKRFVVGDRRFVFGQAQTEALAQEPRLPLRDGTPQRVQGEYGIRIGMHGTAACCPGWPPDNRPTRGW